MSQYAIDPELAQRRLKTLVRLLEEECVKRQSYMDQLTPLEMKEWARQCANLLNGPARAPTRKAVKPMEQMTDEELLS